MGKLYNEIVVVCFINLAELLRSSSMLNQSLTNEVEGDFSLHLGPSVQWSVSLAYQFSTLFFLLEDADLIFRES